MDFNNDCTPVESNFLSIQSNWERMQILVIVHINTPQTSNLTKIWERSKGGQHVHHKQAIRELKFHSLSLI